MELFLKMDKITYPKCPTCKNKRMKMSFGGTRSKGFRSRDVEMADETIFCESKGQYLKELDKRDLFDAGEWGAGNPMNSQQHSAKNAHKRMMRKKLETNIEGTPIEIR